MKSGIYGLVLVVNLISIFFSINLLLYRKHASRYGKKKERCNQITSYEEDKTLCPLHPENIHGREPLNRSIFTLEALQTTYDYMDHGHFRPVTCIPRQKVAIIIPYRDREKGLFTLLNNVVPRIRRQHIEFGIYVVEQIAGELFNKGVCFNVGFEQAMTEYNYDCVVLHDVDIIAENDRNFFSCGYYPKHLAVNVEQYGYKLPYKYYIGGITNMASNVYRQINGFSNQYEGWGLEDDDLYRRLTVVHNLDIERPPAKVSFCGSVNHSRKHKWNKNRLLDRCNIYINRPRGWAFDGLSTLKYQVEKIEDRKLYKWILISFRTSKMRQEFVERFRIEDYKNLQPVNAVFNGNTKTCYWALKKANKTIDQSLVDIVQKSKKSSR
ncbi:B4GALT4 [Mytilus coruscus]|uniref:Beta-1,4-galactosyltransferase n=1 Tax=Mytilus coruscus TaxID=42192 RepID=A0A6J8ELD4_MYTCO|nr:B4GALT4 [Mytilus coruscus]